jgi:hypothetical protein
MSGTSLRLVYIAGNTVDAGKAERVLTERGIDYALRLERYASTSVMLVGEHTGLFVYVPVERHESCRVVLEQNGLMDTVALDAGLPAENSHGA